jgi:dienelactone hydrolase
MNAILDLGIPITDKGVTTRHLWISGHDEQRVPGLVLTPEGASGARPVILLGHGAGGSKDDPQMLSIGRWFVRREGWAVAIIDGPVHGERRSNANGNVGLEARASLINRGTYDSMAVDWHRTLDACGELSDVGADHAAYMGFSMGCVLGILTVAQEPRIRTAVLAIGGILQDERNFLNEAAESITRPVLMINQSEDEIFSRTSTFRLYDALAGSKRVIFHPGLHSAVPREAMELTRSFLHAELTEAAPVEAPRGAH